ncbi:MAG: transcriptional regulator [Solibacillus sp.]
MEQKRRKDQWTTTDDERLAEIVIQTVQNGRTQLEAFEEAAGVLNRTKQACGFRWNKTLRHQYGQMLNNVRKRPKQLMRSHLKLALTSFEELTEAYNELELKYNELHTEHEKMLRWIQQGFLFLSKEEKTPSK